MILHFDRVSFHYGVQKETSSILEEVSFCLAKGELVALTGSNGSGKSTLALLGAGLLLPNSGTVTIEAIDTISRCVEIQRKVGIVFQNPDDQIVGTTVEEDIAFGLENLSLPSDEIIRRIAEVCERLNLEHLRHEPIHKLSGGLKQKLAIAAILAMEPDLIILDEPTSHLDAWARQAFWALIGELRKHHGIAFLCISQRPSDLENIPRVLVLHEGRLVFDGLSAELWQHPEHEIWGCRPPESVLLKAIMEPPHD